MTNQDNHQNNVVQDIQRVAIEVADVLIDVHRNDAIHDDLDIVIDYHCRKTLRNIADQEFRDKWTQFYTIYINGVK